MRERPHLLLLGLSLFGCFSLIQGSSSPSTPVDVLATNSSRTRRQGGCGCSAFCNCQPKNYPTASISFSIPISIPQCQCQQAPQCQPSCSYTQMSRDCSSTCQRACVPACNRYSNTPGICSSQCGNICSGTCSTAQQTAATAPPPVQFIPNPSVVSPCQIGCQNKCQTACQSKGQPSSLCTNTCSNACQFSCSQPAITATMAPTTTPTVMTTPPTIQIALDIRDPYYGTNCQERCDQNCLSMCVSMGNRGADCQPACQATCSESCNTRVTMAPPAPVLTCTPACQPTCSQDCIQAAVIPPSYSTGQSSSCVSQCAKGCEAGCPTADVHVCSPSCAAACEQQCYKIAVGLIPDKQAQVSAQTAATLIPTVTVATQQTQMPQCIPACMPACEPLCVNSPAPTAPAPITMPVTAASCIQSCQPACEPSCVQKYTVTIGQGATVASNANQNCPQACQPACETSCIQQQQLVINVQPITPTQNQVNSTNPPIPPLSDAVWQAQETTLQLPEPAVSLGSNHPSDASALADAPPLSHLNDTNQAFVPPLNDILPNTTPANDTEIVKLRESIDAPKTSAYVDLVNKLTKQLKLIFYEPAPKWNAKVLFKTTNGPGSWWTTKKTDEKLEAATLPVDPNEKIHLPDDFEMPPDPVDLYNDDEPNPPKNAAMSVNTTTRESLTTGASSISNITEKIEISTEKPENASQTVEPTTENMNSTFILSVSANSTTSGTSLLNSTSTTIAPETIWATTTPRNRPWPIVFAYVPEHSLPDQVKMEENQKIWSSMTNPIMNAVNYASNQPKSPFSQYPTQFGTRLPHPLPAAQQIPPTNRIITNQASLVQPAPTPQLPSAQPAQNVASNSVHTVQIGVSNHELQCAPECLPSCQPDCLISLQRAQGPTNPQTVQPQPRPQTQQPAMLPDISSGCACQDTCERGCVQSQFQASAQQCHVLCIEVCAEECAKVTVSIPSPSPTTTGGQPIISRPQPPPQPQPQRPSQPPTGAQSNSINGADFQSPQCMPACEYSCNMQCVERLPQDHCGNICRGQCTVACGSGMQIQPVVSNYQQPNQNMLVQVSTELGACLTVCEPTCVRDCAHGERGLREACAPACRGVCEQSCSSTVLQPLMEKAALEGGPQPPQSVVFSRISPSEFAPEMSAQLASPPVQVHVLAEAAPSQQECAPKCQSDCENLCPVVTPQCQQGCSSSCAQLCGRAPMPVSSLVSTNQYNCNVPCDVQCTQNCVNQEPACAVTCSSQCDTACPSVSCEEACETVCQGQCTFSGQDSRACAPACKQSCRALCAKRRVKRDQA